MREYESIFVLEPEATDADVDVEVEKIRDIVSQGSGEITEIQKWGRRKLAYEINKKTEGIYTLVRFQAANESLLELNRRFRMNESLLRHLVVEYEGPFPGEFTGVPAAEEGEGAPAGENGDKAPAPAPAPAPAAGETAQAEAPAPAPEAVPEKAELAGPAPGASAPEAPEAQADPAGDDKDKE